MGGRQGNLVGLDWIWRYGEAQLCTSGLRQVHGLYRERTWLARSVA